MLQSTTLEELPVETSKAFVLTAARTVSAAETGATFYLSLAGGFTVTLPAAALGLQYTFIVKTAPTTAYIVAAATADTMGGSIVTSATGAADTEADITGDQFNFVASTAVVGDRITLNSDGTGWYGYGVCSVAGGITITG